MKPGIPTEDGSTDRVRRLWTALRERLFGDRGDASAWRGMVRSLGITLAGGIAAVAIAIYLIDPYDVVPFSPPADRPMMDLNQRWLYPGVARSGRFDSLVIGTSTIRLLDPKRLDAAFGGRFANFAMNSATAWEQAQIARVFLHANGPPKTLVIGIDSVWCAPDADRQRITFRGFPEWMYDDNRWNDLLHILNSKTLEIAGRMVGYWLGLREPRYRYDGFEVFVPPEETYDLARARTHLYPGGRLDMPPVEPPVRLSPAVEESLRFPAHDWVDALLGETGGRSRVILAAMPVHVAAQPRSGSEAAAIEEVCLDRLAAIAQRHGALMVDWRYPSALTREDSNYWDPLHYRLPIAERLVDDLRTAIDGGSSPEGTWRVTARPAKP
jgi:hypothetical protein